MVKRDYKAGERVSADEFKRTVTYAVGNGRFINFDMDAVGEYGATELLRAYVPGYQAPTERVPVIQYGRRIGTMPADFDPRFARSNSFMYDVRPGDFTREGDAWVVGRTMGAGDVDCVIGFVRDESKSSA